MKSSHQKLFIWDRAVDLAVQVIAVTDSFPHRQRRVLVEQMQRSAVSIPSNIAEGKGRLSQRELRQFLGFARGSLFELETQLEIARRCGLLDEPSFDELARMTTIIGLGINNLIARLKTVPTSSKGLVRYRGTGPKE
jgi:four helix bundle protein